MSGCTGNGMERWGRPKVEAPNACGQILFSVNGATFEPVLPLLDDDGNWLSADDDFKIVLHNDECP